MTDYDGRLIPASVIRAEVEAGNAGLAGMGSRRPRLLDLYCGGGGAGVGYARAGFDVVGVDKEKQGNYPFEFIQADAIEYVKEHGHEFDAIHASPPCQLYTRKAADWGRRRKHWLEHPDLVGPTREALDALGRPYIIENVPGAPIRADVLLCGTMFGLRIQRHRLFELSLGPALDGWLPVPPEHKPWLHADCYNPWQGKGRSAARMRVAMGIPWLPISGGMSRKAGYTGDLFNAIPPAYTEWLGGPLLVAVGNAAAPVGLPGWPIETVEAGAAE